MVARCTISSRHYTPLFVHYFESKEGRGRLLEYLICLEYTLVQREVNDIDDDFGEHQRRRSCTMECQLWLVIPSQETVK